MPPCIVYLHFLNQNQPSEKMLSLFLGTVSLFPPLVCFKNGLNGGCWEVAGRGDEKYPNVLFEIEIWFEIWSTSFFDFRFFPSC